MGRNDISSEEKGRSRRFLLTWNNYTDADYDLVANYETQYTVLGCEVGSKCGTPHFHAQLCFTNPRSLDHMRATFKCDVRICKGSPDEVREYCIKDGDFIEHGTIPKSPKRRGADEKARYEKARELARSGEIDDIDADIFIRHYNAIKRIHADRVEAMSVPSRDELDNEWYWGPTGTGKSKRARMENPDAYIKNSNDHWWCGYSKGLEGHAVVILDEVQKTDGPQLAKFLKIWADHYAFRANVKGGSYVIRPQKLIVTSNYHPQEIFHNLQDLDPILRRFKIEEFK